MADAVPMDSDKQPPLKRKKVDEPDPADDEVKEVLSHSDKQVSEADDEKFMRPSNAEEEYKPRIGPKYQVDVPEFSEPTQTDRKHYRQLQKTSKRGGTCLWKPHQLPEELVEQYLDFGHGLFTTEEEQERGKILSSFCEERGLYFLLRCNFNVDDAVDLLRPMPPDKKDKVEEQADEEFDGDDFCLVCGEGGNLILCDATGCQKAYHSACVKLTRIPTGKWECPRHFCATCNDRVALDVNSVCSQCTNAYCKRHVSSEALKISKEISTGSSSSSETFLCLDCCEKYRPGSVSQKQKKSARVVFYEQLRSVMEEQSVKLTHVPFVGDVELDLFLLYKQVCRAGGIAHVLNRVGWSAIKDALKLSHVSEGTEQLQAHYMGILYAYERKYFAGFQPVDPSIIRAASQYMSRREKAKKRKSE